ncbi:MAG: hypothetical protein JNJ40_13745 [Bacteroidia bacterium]|nr:hypothetical protein [Bacteroidia bacterium]
MEEKDNIKIIKLIQYRVGEVGRCSVGEAAEKIVFYKIPLSERERIALRIIKSEEFLMKKTEDDIIVFKNPLYTGSLLTIENEKQFTNLKYIIAVLVSLAIGLTIKFFSPRSEEIHPPSKESYKNILEDSAFHLKWVRMSDSINKSKK